MISGLVVLSSAEWGCYPYLESILSFLPVVDEMVVVFNIYGRRDGSLRKVKDLDKKIRIIPTVFDLEKYGWISYGIARTIGYHACKGDIILMFDADGVLHEKDRETILREVNEFSNSPNFPTGFWQKRKFYHPNTYYSEYKHAGIYNKGILGDRLDFMMPDGRGVPNHSKLKPNEVRSKKFNTILFGYEHLWDTEEVLRIKVNRYGRMIDAIAGKKFSTPEEYFERYMIGLIEKLDEKEKKMDIKDHPQIMHKKLKEINETHFGHSFFGRNKG